MTREEIWNKAYKRIFELYGEYPNLKLFSVNRALLSLYLIKILSLITISIPHSNICFNILN